ncbi:cysteine--tRNA ligase, chloroplastic/mitochondrial isoform X1 [Cinnamomum micranthum f. kanehirae]|uniref:Cysteine--tRNA ligase, chloroplastic/mitochondrial isoform X1 n=1 Tax=Cinnamomum micranthum f. kanehirae TaxID=337451 RepID=A0A443NHP1_9MAGN|nr:cysteine--tRNA ligase, chloroplastic/mitochondrial isoform X1 [Cinnamomum micranthum f. kanehirae]
MSSSLLRCNLFVQQSKDEALKSAGLTEDEVLQQIEERALARKNKGYAKSDEIHRSLSDIGNALMDVPEREQYGDNAFLMSSNSLEATQMTRPRNDRSSLPTYVAEMGLPQLAYDHGLHPNVNDPKLCYYIGARRDLPGSPKARMD